MSISRSRSLNPSIQRQRADDVRHSDVADILVQQRRVTVQEQTRIVVVFAADVAVESPKV